MTNLNQMLNWSAPKRLMTMRGEKMVSEAAPTQAFWDVWRREKETLKSAGISVKKVGERFVVCRWEDLGAEHQAKLAEAREASRATPADIAIPAPAGLAYLPYQRAGINFACQRPASLIADEMGLGKTIQAIGVVNASGAKTVLVICPASLRLNWKRELGKWLVTPRAISVIETGKTPWPGELAEVVIINYDLLKKFRRELRQWTWDVLIADECHAIKNSKSQRTKEVVGHQPRGKDDESWTAIPAKNRLLLTGTPIVNRPSELWPIISFLNPGQWKNWFAFAKRYCGAVHNGYGWDFSGASHLDELQNFLRESIMVRRLKAEVLKELPPKRRQIITVPANGAADCIKAEKAAEDRHEVALNAARIAVELAKAGASDEEYQAAVQRLRDLSNAAFTELARLRHDTAVAKVPYVVEHLENCSGKVVVMAHHHDVVDAIEAALGPACVTLTGRENMAARQASVDRFQNDPDCRFFIGSIRAAGVGLTLTAASHVVFAELDWTPGAMSQAEDRCHRIGQINSVLVQHIVLDGSIDARMVHTIVAKQEVITEALDTEHAATVDPTFDLDAAVQDASENAAAMELRRKLWQAEKDAERAEREAKAMAKSAARESSRKQLEEKAATLTDAQVADIHTALRLLDALNQDRAQMQNMMGYNKIDTGIGCELASRSSLTKMQAALGHKILRKYKRQLPADLYDALYPEKTA